MLKILLLGDISGKMGRSAVKKILPRLKKQLNINLVVANGENMAHGTGFTEDTMKELIDAGVDWFTGGDHSFDKEKYIDKIYDGHLPIVRPANYSAFVPGFGHATIEIKKDKILLINLIGRVFMKMDYDCPFRKLDEILANISLSKNKYSAIIIDVHAEATSEKVALKHYANGRVSAVLGTHTHIMTADGEVTEQGTAYISDVGMCGAADECIGVEKEGIIETFLTQIKTQQVIPEKGRAIFSGVVVTVNPKNGKATEIKSIQKFIEVD